MNLPNFLVIGAARSGSTALFDYLSQHPEIFVSDPKEPHFFAFDDGRPDFTGPGDEEVINRVAVTGEDAYRALFRGSGDARAVGEGSVSYLYYPRAPRNIRRRVPEARLVCILRNPADRAYSAFRFTRARMHEPLPDFREALAREEERIEAGWHHIWHYRRMGRYHEQLRRFYRVFDEERTRIYRFEDFVRDPSPVLRDCFEFLKVDPDFRPRRRPVTVPSGEPRLEALQRYLLEAAPVKRMVKRIVPGELRRWLSRRIRKANLRKPPMDPEIRRELLDDYREGIHALSYLTGRDFTGWLESEDAGEGNGGSTNSNGTGGRAP